MSRTPAARPRLDRSTARRLDRLARRAHAFHRFAHHPLCSAYESEVIRIGPKLRLCRGCTFTALGLAAGAAAGVVVAFELEARATLSCRDVTTLAASLLLIAVAVAGTSLTSSRVRRHKWLTRGIAPASFASGLALALSSSLGAARAALAALAVAFGSALIAAYRRRGPNRDACASCPERRASPCSGLLPIVRRERAFQRRALALIDTRAPLSPR